MAASPPPSSCRLCRQTHEARHVLRPDLHPGLASERIDAEGAEILVEVAALGRDHDRLDPGRVRPFDQAVARTVTGWIVVAQDIEPPQRVREQDGGEMGCGEDRKSVV